MPYPLPNNSYDLTGQVALVTGASAGLGRHFAKVLAAAGADVALAARRRDRLESLAEEIRAMGRRAVAIEMDATDAAQLTSAVDRAEAELGDVTILVNNAGIPDAKRAHKMPLDLIDTLLSINVRAPFVLACDVARRLIEKKKPGRIVNIASIAAFFYDGDGAALYSTSKAAVVRMTETLAVEWSRYNINVNAIAPGAFRSDMLEGMMERMGDITQRYPRKRIGEQGQLDSTLLYLVAPSSDAVTGTCIKVDDGQTLR